MAGLSGLPMLTPRFFVDAALAAGEQLELPPPVAHHALRVLRLADGQPIALFNGRGGEYHARLRRRAGVVSAAVETFVDVERESPLELTLVQALLSAEKMDWVVEKAVELGAARIVIAPAQRGAARLDAARRERRLRHWLDVARAACGQSGRNRVPPIELLDTLDAALTGLADDGPRLLLLPGADAALLRQLPGRRAALLVGPEGGLTDAEVRLAESAGFTGVRLGPRILRTETAGLAALAALQAAGGDFAAM